jgi:hypothetical protein
VHAYFIQFQSKIYPMSNDSNGGILKELHVQCQIKKKPKNICSEKECLDWIISITVNLLKLCIIM